MKRISQHKLLVAGESFEHCTRQVHKFFDLTSLVIYDCIEARPEASCSGLDSGFSARIEQAVNHNRRLVREFTADLEKAGVHTAVDLPTVEQGFVSKTLHILAHFLDGFIGIDSHFYNLTDDSHWVPASTAAAIAENPGHYWLIHIDCYSATPEEAGILRL